MPLLRKINISFKLSLNYLIFTFVLFSVILTNEFVVNSVNQKNMKEFRTFGKFKVSGSVMYDICLVKTDSDGVAHWDKIYGGTDSERGYALIQTADGGFALAGNTQSYGAGELDCWLVKTDSNGEAQWSKTYGGEKCETIYALVQTLDGGYAMLGDTNSFGAVKSDMWLIKTDSNGEVQWNMTYGGANWDYGYALIQTSTGGFVLTGEIRSYNDEYGDVWLVKTDRNGVTQWNMTYGEINRDCGYALIQTADEGYAIAGYTSSLAENGGAMFFVKTDMNGVAQWFKTYRNLNCTFNIAYAMIQTIDGGFALAGENRLSGGAGDNMFLVKTNNDGVVQWNQTYGGIDYEAAYGIIQTADGGFILAGQTSTGGEDMWLVKTDENGEKIWDNAYRRKGFDYTRAIVHTTDGGFAFVGYSGLSVSSTKNTSFSEEKSSIIYSFEFIPFLVSFCTLIVVLKKRKKV